MIVVLAPGHTPNDIAEVERHVRELGYEPHTIRGEVRTVVAAVGDETTHRSLEILSALPCVERVIPVQKRYKLVSRSYRPETHVVRAGGREIGSGVFHLIAGPCSIESYEQLSATAKAVGRAGATFLRGGAFKPRTSPYDFQGLKADALGILRRVKEESGLAVVTEIVRESDIERMSPFVDILQIGARNAMNYSLLESVAAAGKPVLLKRGMAATFEEWMLAAEYLVKNGNPDVVLCERGIRTFETATRNTLDVSAVALAKRESNLPVMVDPSHAAGRADLVPALSCAAIAAGADGLMVEVHPDPEAAASDAQQQLTPAQFEGLVAQIAPFVKAAGMRMASGAAAG